MVNKDFSSLSELFKYLDNEAKKTLRNDETNIKNVVVSKYIENIEDNIYSAYTPLHYKRQMEHGGLIDRDNFRVENTLDGIAISSSRRGVDGNGDSVDVMEVIEGYKPWAVEDLWGYGFDKPRHAVEPTIENLKKNGDLLNRAFRLDLQNRGFSVE